MSSPSPTPPASMSPPKKDLGLSELSKQLRILQATNQAQSIELERLERQLKILAELQGISVAQLRQALQDACQAQAHDELQHRVAILQAQLQAASLANKGKATTVRAESQAQHVANLELRVGELEEVEESLRKELKDLYEKLKGETAEHTRLKAIMSTQQQQPQPETALVAYQPPPPNNNILEAQLEHGQRKVLEQQLEAAEKQHQLRQAQFQARFTVQNERIDDLEQQLESLYAAFELLQQEHEHAESRRETLQTNLDSADAQVAQQVRHLDHLSTTRTTATTSTVIPPSPQSSSRSVAAASPMSPLASPSTSSRGEVVLSSVLLVKSNDLLKRWKKRRATLYRTFTHYELIVSEESNNANAKSYQLFVGVSKVHVYAKHPFAFCLETPVHNGVVEFKAAATSPEDFDAWMSALTVATGAEDATTASTSTPRKPPTKRPSLAEQEASELEAALQLSTKER